MEKVKKPGHGEQKLEKSVKFSYRESRFRSLWQSC